MHQPYPTYNRRSLLYADMDRCLTGLYHLGDPGDNRESLSFYRIDRSTANRRRNRALLRLQQFAKGCVLAVEASEHLFTKCS